MTTLPSLPLFVDAYLADTTHLSTLEHGVYFLLLMAMWRRGGKVPDDDRDLARITGLSVMKWRRLKQRLLPLLDVKNGELSQKRLKKEWAYLQKNRIKNQKNGARGGIAKANKNKHMGLANGVAPTPTPTPNKKTPDGVFARTRNKRARPAAGKPGSENDDIDAYVERLKREEAHGNG